ncbi:MAG: DegT/DnrJ/EryC1/StrS family aminotransferase [Bdellovibrio sp.]
MIHVTKPYLPERKKLDKYLDKVYESSWLTNNGPLVNELTEKLSEYLGVKNLLLVNNGTLALQIAYRALNVNAQASALTTPFSFIATASTLKWEGLSVEFSDIDPSTYCLDPKKLSGKHDVIVPVHVFGNSCDIDGIQKYAEEKNAKVVYDGAHSFGVRYKGKSIFEYGDATTMSFHATKLFHTAEGGAIVFKDREALDRARLLINFGINGPDSIVGIGINSKMNELQAAMGLSVLEEISIIFEKREEVWNYYQEKLNGLVGLQTLCKHSTNNFAYFPILLKGESEMLKIKDGLNCLGIFPRRYFYPSLDTIGYLGCQSVQPISRDIASRILCLPVYPDLVEGKLYRHVVESLLKVL